MADPLRRASLLASIPTPHSMSIKYEARGRGNLYPDASPVSFSSGSSSLCCRSLRVCAVEYDILAVRLYSEII
jgi:hypothetical protein